MSRLGRHVGDPDVGLMLAGIEEEACAVGVERPEADRVLGELDDPADGAGGQLFRTDEFTAVGIARREVESAAGRWQDGTATCRPCRMS